MDVNFFDLIILLIGIAFSLIFIRNLRFWQRSTGGKLDDFLNRWEVYAPQAYAKIRGESDIESIANNTGLSIRKIQRIKRHIFFEEHQLDDGIRLFDPDPDIADAWFRLRQGDYNDEDLRLLEH
jgi:hypothetical protein